MDSFDEAIFLLQQMDDYAYKTGNKLRHLEHTEGLVITDALQLLRRTRLSIGTIMTDLEIQKAEKRRRENEAKGQVPETHVRF